MVLSKSAQKAEWGTVTELKKQTLIDFLGQEIKGFYNLISKTVLIKA